MKPMKPVDPKDLRKLTRGQKAESMRMRALTKSRREYEKYLAGLEPIGVVNPIKERQRRRKGK